MYHNNVSYLIHFHRVLSWLRKLRWTDRGGGKSYIFFLIHAQRFWHPLALCRTSKHPLTLCRSSKHPLTLCRTSKHPLTLCRTSKHPLTWLRSLYHIPSKKCYVLSSQFLKMGIMVIMGTHCNIYVLWLCER
jgi:hypothetical protein